PACLAPRGVCFQLSPTRFIVFPRPAGVRDAGAVRVLESRSAAREQLFAWRTDLRHGDVARVAKAYRAVVLGWAADLCHAGNQASAPTRREQHERVAAGLRHAVAHSELDAFRKFVFARSAILRDAAGNLHEPRRA